MPIGIYKHKRGYHLSEDHRKKIGIATSKYRTGRRLSDIHKINIGKAGLGKKHRPFSEATKIKMSIARTGIHMSKATRIKMSESNKGSKSWRWKGGITPEHKIIRANVESRLWRESVFARDNWTCQKTKVKGCFLHAHHIKNFAEYPELRFAIDNGITFSKKAHDEFHKSYGYKNNTLEQVIEFICAQQRKSYATKIL